MRVLLFVLSLVLVNAPAMADIFVWKDAETEVKASFPDTWKIINNQKPDTILTVIAPDSKARPICRLRVREDNRFRMYPVQFESEIQRVAYSDKFWKDYLVEQYDIVNTPETMDRAGLGKSFASRALFSYNGEVLEDNLFRQGLVFASHYYDFAVIAECTANQIGWAEWAPQFMSFFASIDYPNVYGTHVNGEYRDFISRDAYQE
ncbi:MAG: hypothetical protein H6855_04110 [Rhodospirillales bacterium]|nr:hypothetical protein [Rhodospirillales bacterium]MCB9972983.1 hypothetical protein [Rhodospirillales bacterium]MCB9980029.1 hypothetical protein [Rhodospirillales bacterium]